MTRWIIAGVLLAVLIVLVVTDEMGYAPMEPGPDGEVAALNAGEDLVDPPPPGGEDTDEMRRIQVNEICRPTLDTLVAAGGEQFRDDVGNVLYGDQGMKPEQVADLCKSFEGKSQDEIVAKITELTGLTP